MSADAPVQLSERHVLVRRGRDLAWLTIGWNSIEGLVASAAGLAAGSIALVAFGGDSYVEVAAGLVVLWRLSKERHGEAVSAAAELTAVRLIATTFLLLAVAVTVDASHKLLTGEQPDGSLPGVLLTSVSLVVMPLLARAKRRVATEMGSRALAADAIETQLCVDLSGAFLVGLAANALLGWWWADPAAALAVAALAGKEGVEHLRAEKVDDCCA